MIKITLLGNPRSTQTCYRYRSAGKFISGYMSKECKTLKNDYIEQITTQYTSVPIQTPVRVKMSLLMGTKRRADIDNFNKLVFDALSGIVYEDDSQIIELHIIKGYDKENPRVELEITPVNN